jgi:hypothetical protein
METIYAWTEIDPDGGEGIIFAFIPAIGMTGNLQHRNRNIVEAFRPIAKAHAKSTGHKVRLVKFARDETLETL